MPDPDVEIRGALERVTGPVDGGHRISFDQLVKRRRRRRLHRAALGVLPVVLVLGLVGSALLFTVDSDDATVTAAEGEPAPATTDRVTVARTEVVADEVGTIRVVMEFDRPLPVGGAAHVEDITSVDTPDSVLFTTQPPSGVHVCADTHFFGASAGGTVDVLIPSRWFADGHQTYTSRLDRIGEPPKFVVCGPHRGFYQYSIWGPASADADDVVVTIDPDDSRLIVQIDSPDMAGTVATQPGT